MKARVQRARKPRGIEMPADLRWLYTHGRLTPAEARALGALPVMTCATCHMEVTLVTTFEPIPEDKLATTPLPAMCWGRDVLVLCPRCSARAGCWVGEHAL